MDSTEIPVGIFNHFNMFMVEPPEIITVISIIICVVVRIIVLEAVRVKFTDNPNFERMTNEDEENDVSKAWAVPGRFSIKNILYL